MVDNLEYNLHNLLTNFRHEKHDKMILESFEILAWKKDNRHLQAGLPAGIFLSFIRHEKQFDFDYLTFFKF